MKRKKSCTKYMFWLQCESLRYNGDWRKNLQIQNIIFSEINTYIYRCRHIISIQNCFVK